MGIPSYFSHLVKNHPSIIKKYVKDILKVDNLYLDCNSIIYDAYSKMEFDKLTESVAISIIRRVIYKIEEYITVIKPSQTVIVAFDGVAPVAKLEQQRSRRYKSWYQNEISRMIFKKDKEDPWNTTAITPGTKFMAELNDMVSKHFTKTVCDKFNVSNIVVSGSDKVGEGEHKLMTAMRARKPRSCTIYGLDADLILLALLLDAETGCQVVLLREAQEFESRAAEGGFRHLLIRDLGNVLVGGVPGRAGRIRDYVATMTLLGNDFLPHGLTRTVHDDGVPVLLDILRREVWSARRSVVCPATGFLLREGVRSVVRAWAATEEADMLRSVEAAVGARASKGRVPAGKEGNPVAEALAEWQATPARWCALGRLLSVKTGGLLPTWRSVVRESWGAGADGGAYLEGVAWVWDYYSGRMGGVCQGWVYDRHLPPLWSDVLAALEAGAAGGEVYLVPPTVRWREGLVSWVHLLAVLPAESARRLLPADRLSLLRDAPWYWPSEWSLFDVGRSQMWQCEPVLPLIPESVLRSLA
jgi:5'-3' exonuclease